MSVAADDLGRAASWRGAAPLLSCEAMTERSRIVAPVPNAENDHVGDAELVARARRGGRAGREAFGVLAARHQPWLVRLVRYYAGGDVRDADDIAQDALVRAYVSIDGCPRGEGFRAWLRKIATRLAYNHHRDSRTRARYQDAAAAAAPTSTRADASGRFRERDAIERALGDLSYASREILILRYVEELSIAEIADELELGVSAAKMRLARARADFERFYDDGGSR